MYTQEACVRRETDRGGGASLIDVFSLGDIRLNAFPWPNEESAPAYPLDIAYSPESKLVQLRHSVDPELMFREYWYHSGTNESMAAHLRDIVKLAESIVKLSPGDIVVDIGCNDGTMLSQYPDWVTTIGFDPAKDLAPDIDIFVNNFFKPEEAVTVVGKYKAKVVSSIAMFYDIEDPVAFARGVYNILEEEGIWIIEMHYLHTMLEKNEVDAICHEHLCYYSLEALSNVLRQAGMSIIEIEFNSVNGGSMLAVAKKANRASAPSPLMQSTLNRERQDSLAYQLETFKNRIEMNARDLKRLLKECQEGGLLVYGYGASTKGNTLLQYAGITPEILPCIAERNPAKWGRETVGTRIPIISEEQMRKDRPDILLALPYHFIDSFKEREPWATWMVPVPEPRILS